MKHGIKQHKNKIFAALAVCIVLLLAFFLGGNPKQTNAPEQNNLNMTSEHSYSTPSEVPNVLPNVSAAPQTKPENSTKKTASTKDRTEAETPTASGKHTEAPPPESADFAAQKEDNTKSELHCSLSVICKNAIDKTKEKATQLPENGIIFQQQNIVFYEGETVFNVLVREMKKHKIHLEFVNIPIYNSAYIEGIHNLYEFDCGELSGWMYKVNGQFPNYGSSRYPLKNGDSIEWVYTCDFGKDVGGNTSARNGMEYE